MGLKVKLKKKEFAVQFSDDQKIAYDKILELLSSSGVNVESKSLSPLNQKKNKEVAIIGKAGSGKTLLLAKIVTDLNELGAVSYTHLTLPTKA